ncbi:MFS transporter [Mixta intestinalis]|jgi:polyol permease family|uniref:Alpha-ketoglutarate permease n=1 Tax=Mixta intestinalis TaxID=1615494 RepID=A0A6P1Q0J2_9GAMM|nr:MFS transporter [Mixta intestinalis]QHM71629.1 Alpha-ketoglutarate permease [Mixta intestinalis]
MTSAHSEPRTFLGLRTDLIWGLLGVLLFIVGDGVEQAWISPYLIDRGLTMPQSATLIAIYGIAVAIGAWLSGVMAEALGPRKTMLLGAMFWLIGQVLFLLIALPTMNFAIIIPTYCIRGLGYPLFCYSFLVWVTYRNPAKTLATAVGWFYLAFTGGLYIVANFYASLMIPVLGHIGILWSAIVWALAGTVIVLVCVKGNVREKTTVGEQLSILMSGISIIRDNPKVGIGGLVRLINTTSQFALPVFFPVYLAQHGFTTEQWLQVWALTFTVNIAFNLIWGMVGDRIGWGRTVQIFGGFGCACTMLLMAWMPVWFSGNYPAMLLMGCIYGALIAGFCPLTALVPSLEPERKGAAMSVLNLGAGLSSFVGPSLVALLFTSIGARGVLVVFAILYVVSIFLTGFVTLDKKAQTGKDESLTSTESA